MTAEGPDAMPHRLSELSGFLLAEEPGGVAFRRVLDLALARLPLCDGAGITMARKGGCATLVDNDQIAAAGADLQYATGEGPCGEAMRSARLQVVDSTARDSRWPRFARLAGGQGILSCLALPLQVRDRPFAVLNLYSRSVGTFAGLAPDIAGAVMIGASIALANAVAYEDSRQLLEHLARLVQLVQAADGDVVAQAQGILMEQEGGDAEIALATLIEEARRQGASLEEIARALVASLGSGRSSHDPAGEGP